MDEMKLLTFYKKCNKCGESKEWTAFSPHKHCKHKLNTVCKICRNNLRKEQYKNDPIMREKHRASSALHRYARPGHATIYSRKWRESNKKRSALLNRKSHLKVKYGIDLLTFDNLLIEQRNTCAICGRPFTENLVPWIDHDHETLKVRNLLCSRCNTGLGQFEDSAHLLQKAADYLEMHAGKALNI